MSRTPQAPQSPLFRMVKLIMNHLNRKIIVANDNWCSKGLQSLYRCGIDTFRFKAEQYTCSDGKISVAKLCLEIFNNDFDDRAAWQRCDERLTREIAKELLLVDLPVSARINLRHDCLQQHSAKTLQLQRTKQLMALSGGRPKIRKSEFWSGPNGRGLHVRIMRLYVGFLWSQGEDDMWVSDSGGRAVCSDKR